MSGNRRGARGPSSGKKTKSPTLSTKPWRGKVPPEVRTPYRDLPTPVAGPPAIDTVAVSPREMYGSDLPPQGYVPFYRTQSIATTLVTAVPTGSFYEIVMEEVPSGTGLLLYDVQYKWLEDNTDPLDPQALSEMQSQQAINGTITVDLMADGVPSNNNEQKLYDPYSATTEVRRGWATLNTNLLLFGNSPSVLYIRQGQTLTARFYHNRTPGNVPTALYLSLKGYSVPYTNFQKVQSKTRTP